MFECEQEVLEKSKSHVVYFNTYGFVDCRNK